jgi:D-glycero-D-manno-heptose 1,7-bisphosphate phosphatase
VDGLGCLVTELRPAVFIDRDGTMIVERAYLCEPAGVEVIPGVFEALALLREAEFALVIVTNQAGIAQGYYSVEDYHAVASRLDELLDEAGVSVDAAYHCPHHPDMGGPCPCRKPATGMYLDAAQELGLDVGRSYYVGDKLSDVTPALELGGRGILVRTGYGNELEVSAPASIPVVDDLAAAAKLITSVEEGPTAVDRISTLE